MFKMPEEYRKEHPVLGLGDNTCGFFLIPTNQNYILKCIASSAMGWEHVSVSLNNRCPNWIEMCLIKDLFWDEEDCVIQYHPKKSQYINNHPYCLHLWRPTDFEIKTPPSIMIGV